MGEHVDIDSGFERDADLRAIVETWGLKVADASLTFRVRTLTVVRGLEVLVEPVAGRYESRVGKPSTSMTGEAVIEDIGGNPDRLGVWDGEGGTRFDAAIHVRVYAQPDDNTSRLSRTAQLTFDADPFRSSDSWCLSVPLPKVELEELRDAVESGSAQEVLFHTQVGGLFERARDFDPPVHEPTDYFALPRSMVKEGRRTTPHDLRVDRMVCDYVKIAVHGRTLVSAEVRALGGRMRSEQSWAHNPSAGDKRLAAIESARDAARLIAAALFLILLALIF